MKTSGLQELARRYGIAPIEEDGDPVPDQTARAILSAFGVSMDSADDIAGALDASAVLEPPRLRAPSGAACHIPEWLETQPAWGISVQLYELRSQRNAGIGDFADLSAFCRIAARAGADFVGVNPLHALFLADPERRSPFSPSNRQMLNPLYIALDQVPGHVPDARIKQTQVSLRGGHRIDYAAVAAHKVAVLRALHERWLQRTNHDPSWSRAAFEAFREAGGRALASHALFQALSAAMVARGNGSGWRGWPVAFHRPDAPAVLRFAEANGEEIAFQAWLQWVARRQLGDAARVAEQAGMRIGLYLDFAVGEAPDGSATWSDPDLFVPAMSIGAPPDMFTANGQDWGLAPPSPIAMQRSAFEAFRRGNEASMRDAGALRIDHAMGLWQLFFVPEGSSPADGAYVRYPVEEMLRVLAETSRDHGAIVIGEDLGHVPPGFREVMQAARILSYRIMYFEKEETRFIAAEDYQVLALACLSTHDMPTLAGWWYGDDIVLRLEHGLVQPQDAEAQALERERDRQSLLTLFVETGLLDEDQARRIAERSVAAELPEEISVAAHRFIARTNSMLACVRLSDMTGERLQTNLPGTVDGHPNWQLRSDVAIEDLPGTPLFRRIAEAMAAERPRHS